MSRIAEILLDGQNVSMPALRTYLDQLFGQVALLIDYMDEGDVVDLLAGSQVDVTEALEEASATRKRVLLPKGLLAVSDIALIKSDLLGCGMDNDITKIVLTAGGRLDVAEERMHWSNFWVQSDVDGTAFIKNNTHSYFSMDKVCLFSDGATQIGIWLYTGASNLVGIAYNSFRNILFTGNVGFSQAIQTTGDGYCNANEFGNKSTNWSSCGVCVDVGNTGGTQCNHVGGYHETSNDSAIVRVVTAPGSPTIGGHFVNNVLDVHIDTQGTTYAAQNAGGTFGKNTWIGLPPELFLTDGTVLTQNFTEKIRVRAYLSANQAGVVDDTYTKIAFNTVDWDLSGLTAFDAVTNRRFTAPRAMRAVVRAKTNINVNLADTNPVYIAIYKNGTIAHSNVKHLSGSVAPDIEISESVSLGKGDYIEIFVKATGSGAHTVAGGSEFTSVTIEEL